MENDRKEVKTMLVYILSKWIPTYADMFLDLLARAIVALL